MAGIDAIGRAVAPRLLAAAVCDARATLGRQADTANHAPRTHRPACLARQANTSWRILWAAAYLLGSTAPAAGATPAPFTRSTEGAPSAPSTPRADGSPPAPSTAPAPESLAPAKSGAPPPGTHEDAVTLRLGQRLRCPVCQGMPIGDSPSPMAQDMMRQVRRMRAAGRDEAAIERYFTERYGTWVLLDPPKEGIGLWVWILPPAVLALGFAYALLSMRARVQARRPREPGDALGPDAAAGGTPAGAPDSTRAALRAIYHEADQ